MSNGHAKFSPSNSGRWLNCTASMILPEPQERNSNDYAVRGTAIHAYAEQILKGEEPNKDQEGYTLTDEDIKETVLEYIKYVEQVPGTQRWVEEKVYVSEDCYGTADVIKYDSETKTAHIIDLKAGQGVMVYLHGNTQLRIYGLGALYMLEKLELPVERVELHIAQPGMNNMSSVVVPISELEQLGLRIDNTIENIKNGRVEYSPGEEECRWCPHKATCPKLNEKAIEIARGDFAMLEETETKYIDKTKLAKAMTLVPALKHFIKVIEEKSLQALQHDFELPGFKLVRGRGSRKWSDEKAVLADIFTSDSEINLDFVYSPAKLLSVAQMEKSFKKNNIDLDLSEHITKSEGAPKVTREDSPLKTINKTEDAKIEFGNIN